MSYSEKEIVDFTRSNIPNPGLRKLIFGTEDISFDDIKDNPIACIYKCLVVAWMFAFISWKNEDSLEGGREKGKLNANAARIQRSLTSIYLSENISLDLILFTLTEMQLDVINNRRSKYKDIIDERVQNFNINQLRQLIHVWQNSYKHSESNLSKLLDYYTFVIRLLPILNSLQLTISDNEVIFEHRGMKYRSFNTVKYYEQKDPYFYYLRSFTLRSNVAYLEYSDFIGRRIIEEEISRDEFDRNYNLTIGGEKISVIFAQKLYSVDYKYIHNLSLAISDALDEKTKERLFEYYVRTYPDAFKLLDDCSNEINEIIENANWDNAISILMLEAGPSAILEKVINRNYDKFEKLARNLEIRFWGKINSDSLLKEYEEEERKEKSLILKISSDFKSLDELLEKAQGNLMVQTVIRSVTSLVESKANPLYNAAYVETINMRIRNLERSLKSEKSHKEKLGILNKALEKTLHFLIAFYYGLIAYAEMFAQIQDSLPAEATVDNTVFDKCEAAFFDKAYDKAQECKIYPLGRSIDCFRDLSKIFYESIDNEDRDRKIEKKGSLIKNIIGRDYLCDMKTFNKLSQTAISVINDEKHYSAENSSTKAFEAYDYLLKATELLYFFIYNKDYLDERRLNQLISLDPVYPYVVRYCVRSENRDGYNVNNYVVNMASDEMDLEVKLLTEKDYEINELYYCIPNMRGTLPKWWIKPFLIKCRDFDKLFL